MYCGRDIDPVRVPSIGRHRVYTNKTAVGARPSLDVVCLGRGPLGIVERGLGLKPGNTAQGRIAYGVGDGTQAPKGLAF